MNSDLIELLQLLKKHKVKFLVIGGQAVIAYCEPRYTKDLDIWVEASPKNAFRIIKALKEFGAPLASLAQEDLEKKGTIYIFGVEPNRVDILTSVKGRTFKNAYPNRTMLEIEGNLVPFISVEDLLKVKKATKRPQDLIDVKNLERTLRMRKTGQEI